MEKFTHGIMAIDHSQIHEDGHLSVVHFVGFWAQPSQEDFNHIENEIKTDPEFDLIEVAEFLEIVPATQDAIDFFNQNIVEEE